eukprot:334423-Rhodomonas_salina.2
MGYQPVFKHHAVPCNFSSAQWCLCSYRHSLDTYPPTCIPPVLTFPVMLKFVLAMLRLYSCTPS